MKIKFWGTRGSIPTPSTASFLTTRYGGDTACVSVESGNHFVIFDSGTGLRLLGVDMLQRHIQHATFFFSHVHWDHIQGFPFFMPAFESSNSFELYGPHFEDYPGVIGSVLEKSLRGQQEFLTFPVQLNEMPAQLNFKDISPDQTIVLQDRVSKLTITSAALNHPGGCLGYRIEEKTGDQPVKTFAYVTDTEHYEMVNPHVQMLAKNADLFLYDCQYTEDEYKGLNGYSSHVGWGHSTYSHGIKEAKKANAKRILMFHHDPMHDDAFMETMEREASLACEQAGIAIAAATQFLEVTL